MTKFDSTRDVYGKYSKQFADKLDAIPETEQMDEFIGMLPDSAKVLDLGSGSGRDAEYLHKAGLDVMGVDLSEGLVEEAKARRPEIEFQVMDIENLDFPEGSFDGVWSKLTILHVDREALPDILRNVHEVLKPNGVLMIETKAGVGEAFEKVSFNEEEERLFVYYELDELKKLLEDAGFMEVDGYEYVVGNKHATNIKDRVVVFGKKK